MQIPDNASHHLVPDYIVSAEFLLPLPTQKSLIPQGALAVHQDTIIAVGSAEELQHSYPNAPIIHEPHGLIMPGLINTHTHAAMSCFRGLADDLPLMTWLEQHIFPREAALTPEIVHNSTLLSIAEMIKSGTTSFCDMYLFSKEVARATQESGMRGWVGEVLYDFPSPCYGNINNGFSYIEEMFTEYRDNPLLTITVNPHSVYTCAPSLLTRLGEYAEKYESLYVIHLSENEEEVATCNKRYGVRPVAHLDKLGLLHSRTLASHCVILNDTDLDILAARQVKVAHCLESNMKLASGIAPAVAMLNRAITLSLGTDGSASNNDVDLFGEMNSVAKIHKVNCMDPTVMTAEQTLYAATLGGAKALGAENKIGSLEVGKQADFIVLDLDQPHMIPLYNVPSHLVYVARGNDVIHSFIAGRQVMKDRNLLSMDEDAVIAIMQNHSLGIR